MITTIRRPGRFARIVDPAIDSVESLGSSAVSGIKTVEEVIGGLKTISSNIRKDAEADALREDFSRYDEFVGGGKMSLVAFCRYFKVEPELFEAKEAERMTSLNSEKSEKDKKSKV